MQPKECYPLSFSHCMRVCDFNSRHSAKPSWLYIATKGKMSTEIDPLLPRYPGAPEVDTGRRPPKWSAEPCGDATICKSEDDEKSSNVEIPTVKGLITIFFSVMCVALITAFLASRGQTPGSRDDPAIVGRVEKILSENPLIGHWHDQAFIERLSNIVQMAITILPFS